MFGRGTWAIFGLGKESLETFRTTLEDRALMLTASQLAASAITRHYSVDTLGINPFSGPRLDEEFALGLEFEPELAKFASSEPEEQANIVLPQETLDCEGYGSSEPQFLLHASMPWYGLWAISNEWKDVSDVASIREQRSYRQLDRPYKFLQPADKQNVDQDTAGITAAVRKQVPVLIDFNDGRIYIESSNKELLLRITAKLRQLGADIFSVAWSYAGHPHWPSEILQKLHENTQFRADFEKRAEEATRFKANEIEKLEDRELEKIVSSYFSMTQLSSDFWLGITGPTQIVLHDASPAIAVKAPTTATTLLGMTSDAKVLSGAIHFQEVVSGVTKKGDEYTFRKDLLTLDINDKINLTDAGAAMLRGFNVPAFKKDILREIKQTKQVPTIDQFWGNWLHEMGNGVRILEATFREVLDLDGSQEAGILRCQIPGTESAQTPESRPVIEFPV